MSIIIIGNGVAGITAARNIRKYDRNSKITVISSETKYHYSRTALMYIYMGHMKFTHTKPYADDFWVKNNIHLLQEQVNQIVPEEHKLLLASKSELSYSKLVLATGSKSNFFGWPGQDLKGVQGLYHFQDLEQLETNSANAKHAVIVGGGLIGVEFAEMLLSRNISVTFLVRESTFWGNVLPKKNGELISKHISKDHHVDLRLERNLKEITGKDGKVKSIIIQETDEEITCDIVGITAGVSPNINFIKDSGIETNRGILVDEYLRTNYSNIYAIGDCAELRNPPIGRRPIEAVWYVGKMMGETIAKSICGTATTYEPGIWFNSAKFFDIEYQTYGEVLGETPENSTLFHWEHPKKPICFTAQFNTKTHQLEGVNVFGIRLRHLGLQQHLKKKHPIEEVLKDLKNLFFDPEFYSDYGSLIIEEFNHQFQTKLSLTKKRWTSIFN